MISITVKHVEETINAKMFTLGNMTFTVSRESFAVEKFSYSRKATKFNHVKYFSKTKHNAHATASSKWPTKVPSFFIAPA